MNGRRAVVTGGSRGIGFAVAGALAARGWRVVLIARDALALERARGELEGEGHEAVALDVADELSWRQLAGHFGEVDGLVCAAGVLDPVGPIGSYSAADFRRTLEVNVLGTMLAIEACLPALRLGRGAVATFSGGGATAPLPRFDAYAASKAAVARLTENIAVELQSDGVRVNCIAPGVVETPLTQPIKNKPEWYNAYAAKNALGRWASADEMAGPVVFLASAASSYVTGAVLFVDGGWTAIDGRFQPPV